jgi:colanic acid/amylovoran biosynthesis glycosyltransferase
LDLLPEVSFLGMLPHADVLDRLARAHVLIHPSRMADDGDSEGGAPTILLEAQAIGTPIVTTRHADIVNVVPEGAGVILCAERDVDALGQALVTMLQRQERSSPDHVRRHHNIEQAIVQLEDLYGGVIRGRAPTPAVT